MADDEKDELEEIKLDEELLTEVEDELELMVVVVAEVDVDVEARNSITRALSESTAHKFPDPSKARPVT